MAYLITSDLKRLIQTDHLNQIIGLDSAVLNSALSVAIEEVKSYLRHKYDLDTEFSDTAKFAYATTYGYNDRIYLDANGYSGLTSYTLNMMCVNGGQVYRCIASTTGAFDATKWALIGAQYEMFYVKAPVNHTPFDYLKAYNVDDKVIYKNRKYTCKVASTMISATQALEYGRIENLPFANVFPNADNGSTYWTDNGAHNVVNLWPSDTGYWIAADNRNQQIVTACMDVAIYHLHSRIAPTSIPELRVKRYDDAIAWLRRAAKGDDVTADIAKNQPRTGKRFLSGGAVRNENNY
jgi:phage gp36-like protein